jgi:predicted NUDIX family NTP pyrophosphohydrolase
MTTPEFSAGLLLYRSAPRSNDPWEVLIGHMGGPFWARKEEGAWSIPKGHVDEGEAPFRAALREFEEELGIAPPDVAEADWQDLGTVRQSSGKIVQVWAVQADVDAASIVPGEFTMEWPPRSGRQQSFPELDRVAWCSAALAGRLLVRAQREFIARLPLRMNP